jgi:hypothetical protein
MLLTAIRPQPTRATLKTRAGDVLRRLHEPPRRRKYQEILLS